MGTRKRRIFGKGRRRRRLKVIGLRKEPIVLNGFHTAAAAEVSGGVAQGVSLRRNQQRESPRRTCKGVVSCKRREPEFQGQHQCHFDCQMIPPNSTNVCLGNPMIEMGSNVVAYVW